MNWKRAAIAGTLLVACLGFTRQDTLTFGRTFKQGDSDVFDMKMDMQGAMALSASMVMTNTITKVYDNGDADQETAMSDMKVTMNGNEMPTPPQGNQKTTMRINKYGQPTGDKNSPNMMSQMGMDIFKYLKADQGLKVGQAVPVDTTDPKTNAKVKGTFTLKSIDAGVGTLVSNLDMTTEKTADKPIHIDGTTQIDMTSHKFNRMEVKLTGLPANGGNGPQITGMTLVMTRRIK